MFSDLPSIADLHLACEITQLEGIKYPIKEKFPEIYQWMQESMMSIPEFKKIHTMGSDKVSRTISYYEKKKLSEAKM